jgi:hypothetical protein
MMDLSPNAKKYLNAHLEAVRQAMQNASVTDDEIDLVRETLREQIMEMAQSQGEPVTVETIESVIARLEPPQSYANDLSQAQDTTPGTIQTTSRIGDIAIYCAIGAVPLSIIGGVIAGLTIGGGMEFASLLFFVAEISALAFGFAARRAPNGRMGLTIATSAILGYFVLFAIALMLGG